MGITGDPVVIISKLALIKSKLRSTCGQNRLETLVMCSVERDVHVVQNIDECFYNSKPI